MTKRFDWVPLLVAFVLLCVANGRWQLPLAAWLAPIFLLIFIQSQPVRRGLGLAFLAQLLAFFVNWRGMIPVPGAWYYVVAGVYAAVYFAPFVLHRAVASRLAGFRSTLVFPTAWVGVELLFQNLVTPYGSWASLSYTQVDFLPLIQLASLTGSSGIHFVMTWSAAVAARAWEARASLSRVRTPIVASSALLLALLAWGQWRIASAPTEAQTLRVTGLTPSAKLDAELQAQLRAIAGSSAPDESSTEALLEAAARLNDDLLERTRAGAIRGADVIVWSEHAARVMPRTESLLIDRARAIARSHRVPLILGIGLWNPESSPSFENKAVIIDETGELAGTYFKAHPIVGQEAGILKRGDKRIATFETDRGLFATVICHDLDFPGFVRKSGQREVDVLFAPSSDWAEITPLHARMAILRSVENGLSLVRPTATGLSIVVDPLGRVVASELDRGTDGQVLRAQLVVFRLPTLYPVIGDTFACANLVALVLLLASAGRRRGPAGAGAVLLATGLLIPPLAGAEESSLAPFESPICAASRSFSGGG